MIFVFKTSVKNKGEVKRLTTDLNKLLQNPWNIDLDDCDKVLRIDCNTEIADTVVQLFQKNGFICVELL